MKKKSVSLFIFSGSFRFPPVFYERIYKKEKS
jgi:hypothetical protein